MNSGKILNTNNADTHISGLEKKLYAVLFGWPIVVVACSTIAPGTDFSSCIASFGSAFLGLIMLAIALRNYPATRRFLQWFVAVILISALLAGGFYYCATLASDGSLWKTMVRLYSGYVHAQPPIPKMHTVARVFNAITFSLHHPDQDWRIALPVVSNHVICYAYMASPYFTLLLLIAPHALALPVFWLWVLLSVLYVVLPQRAWGWMKVAVGRASANLRRKRTQ